jgi:OTT_1508-like deaminase
MNRNRILCRLRSSHAKWRCNYKQEKLAKAPILPQVFQLFRQKCTATCLSSFNQEVDDLEKHSNSLESSKPVDVSSAPGVRTIVDIVQIVYRLWLYEDFRALLPAGVLQSTFKKLSRYVSAAYFLITEAKRRSILAMFKVEIVACEPLPRTTYIPSPEDLQSVISKIASPVNTSHLYRRLYYQGMKTSVDTESVVINRYGDLVNAKCAVHAEMQLLFHYECLNPSLPPRVICSTKKACYLCNLFFLVHGRFSLPGSHGRLYEKWTFPKRIRDLEGPRAETIHSVVERFFHAIVEAIRHTFVPSSKRKLASNESLFLRSSIWPASTNILEEPVQTHNFARTACPKLNSRSQIVSVVKPSLSNVDISPTPPLAFPTTVMKQAISGLDTSHSLSDMEVVATKNSIHSYQLDEGTSVTFQITDPTKSARVESKSVHFTFASSPDAATLAKESSKGPRQAYTTVECLSAEQRLHRFSSITSVDVAALVPGVDVVLDQNREDHTTHGFYISYGDNMFFVRCWNGDRENNDQDPKIDDVATRTNAKLWGASELV